MEKDKPEFEVEIEVWAGEEKTGGKDNFQIYPWKEVTARKIKMREELCPIVEAVEKVRLPVPVVVLLGNDYYLPLLVLIKKVGNFVFFKTLPDQSARFGRFQMFDGEEEMLLMANETEIQEEFNTKLRKFLKKHQNQDLKEIVIYQEKIADLINKVIKNKAILRQLHL